MGAAAASKQEAGSVMSTVGQIEKRTQARVVQLFQDQLGYDHLGNWIDRAGNANIEPAYLRPFLEAKGYSPRPDHQGHRASDTRGDRPVAQPL
jgi:hypothetical protein